MTAATAPQPDLEQVRRDLEWCRHRGDVLLAQRIDAALEMLIESNRLKEKATTLLMTVDVAEPPSRRYGRREGRCRTV